MKIVLVRFTSIGDVVLQTSLLSWLKLKFPSIKIYFLTSKENLGLLSNHPFIDEIIPYTKKPGVDDIRSLKETSHLIKKLEPDFIIDLHNTLRAKILRLFLIGTPKLIIRKRSFLRKILVRLKIDWLKNTASHHTRVITDLCDYFNESFDHDELTQFNQDAFKNPNLSLSALSVEKSAKVNITSKFIVIGPVASFVNKRWPVPKYTELIEYIIQDKGLNEYQVVICGGANDQDCDKIFENIKNPRVLNLKGTMSLAQTRNFISTACAVVANDTGLVHIAESVGVNTISLFGPTSPSFGFRTHRESSYTFYKNVHCSPCSETGAKKCTQSELKCMNAINAKDVFYKLCELLDD